MQRWPEINCSVLVNSYINCDGCGSDCPPYKEPPLVVNLHPTPAPTSNSCPTNYYSPSRNSYPAAYPAAYPSVPSTPTYYVPSNSFPSNSYSPSTQSYPTQSYPTQSYPTQSYPTQSYPTQSYPTQSYPDQSYPTSYGGYPTVGVCGETMATVDPNAKVPSPQPIYADYSTQLPTIAPEIVVKCPLYSVSNTDSATQNYGACELTLEPGQTVVLGSTGTHGGYVEGDQFLRLWNKDSSYEVALNDDYLYSRASQITYYLSSSAPKPVKFEIREGCFSSGSCSGVVSYAITNGAPPGPTGNWPTGAPTVYVSKLLCKSYSTSQTNSAQNKSTPAYQECQFQLCPGQNATVGSCSDGGYCTGDQYLRLNNASGIEVKRNDDTCFGCSQMKYSLPSDFSECSCYTIIEGCYSMGQCSGVVSVVIEGAPPASSPTNSYPSNSYPSPSSYYSYYSPTSYNTTDSPRYETFIFSSL